ncbi:prepilin-type N-terminal cleavage/methylation domain-containing protein [Elusimicrobium posterum]|uniref:type IV pilin protein n=1 Tax=Elusimicrobium posterum TaxID=3116653 RepID=UPI003C782C16
MNKNVKNPRGGADKGHILSRKAFTLIELLVVVLIIGILAAIALPQYTKAVEKSRIAEAKVIIKSLKDQQQICAVQYGPYADECGQDLFSTMSIDLSGTPIKCPVDADNDTDCYRTQNYDVYMGGPFINLRRNSGTEYILSATSFPEAGADGMGPYSAVINCYPWGAVCKKIGAKEGDTNYYLDY